MVGVREFISSQMEMVTRQRIREPSGLETPS